MIKWDGKTFCGGEEGWLACVAPYMVEHKLMQKVTQEFAKEHNVTAVLLLLLLAG